MQDSNTLPLPPDLMGEEIVVSCPAMWKKGRKKGMLNVINPWACRRVYLLRSGKLRYYDGMKLRGELNVVGGESIVCTPDQTDGRNDTFEVCNKSIPGFVSLFLMAKDNDQRSLWIKSINLLACGEWDKEKEKEAIESARTMPYPSFEISTSLRTAHRSEIAKHRKIWKDNLPDEIRTCVSTFEVHINVEKKYNKTNESGSTSTNSEKRSIFSDTVSSTGMNLSNMFSFRLRSESDQTAVSDMSTSPNAVSRKGDEIGKRQNSQEIREISVSPNTKVDNSSIEPSIGIGFNSNRIDGLQDLPPSPPKFASSPISSSPARKGITTSAILQYNNKANANVQLDIADAGRDWRNEGRRQAQTRETQTKLLYNTGNTVGIQNRTISQDSVYLQNQNSFDSVLTDDEKSRKIEKSFMDCICQRSDFFEKCEIGLPVDLENMEQLLQESEDHSESELRSIIDEKDKFGFRPAHLAASYGHVAYLELLMKHKVDLRPRHFRRKRSESSESQQSNGAFSEIDMNIYADLYCCESLLHACISNNKSNGNGKDCLNLLLNSYAVGDINYQVLPSLWTVLHKASFYGDVDAINVLLKFVPSSIALAENIELKERETPHLLVDLQDSQGRTSLQLAASSGHVECSLALLNHYDYEKEKDHQFGQFGARSTRTNSIDNVSLGSIHRDQLRGGWTAWTIYQLACLYGHHELLREIIRHLIDYLTKKYKEEDNDNESKDKESEVPKKEINNDLIIEYLDPYHNLAHFAAAGGNVDCLKLCHQYSILHQIHGNINDMTQSKNINNTTPLHVASSFGHVESISYILSTGNNEKESNMHTSAILNSCVSKYGRSPVLEACGALNDHGIQSIDILVGAGASIGDIDEEGNGALHVAAERNNIRTVRALVERYGLQGTFTRNRHNQTALEVAMLNSNNEIERMLITTKNKMIDQGRDEIPQANSARRASFIA